MKYYGAKNVQLTLLLILLLISIMGCTSKESYTRFSGTKNNQELEDTSTSDESNTEKIKGRKLQVWDLEVINTGRDANYLNDLEKNVLLEMNKVRSNPQKYAELYLTELRSYYKGKELIYPDHFHKLTEEGVKAVDVCYNYLINKKPVDILMPSERLCKAARDHAIDQGKTGAVGHTGSDGSNPSDRINKYGKYMIVAAENISYGHNIARRIVLTLLVDDGVPSRGHRDNIMRNEFKYAGIAFGSHPEYRYICVIDFVSDYK